MIKFNELLALCTHLGQSFHQSRNTRQHNSYKNISIAGAIAFSVLSNLSCESVSQPAERTGQEGATAIRERIDLNACDARELEKLSGIGSKTATKIVEFRDRHGPFRRPEHLMLVDGISEKKFLAIAPYIEVR